MSKSKSMQEKHPEFFTPDLHIDPRTRTRTVPFQVISAGFSRTGTASMSAALTILGIPCFHSLLLFSQIRDCAMWNDALDAKLLSHGAPFTRADWDQLLGPYGAVADAPAIVFTADLLAAYPDAKVVLVERDVEKWYKSFNDTVIKNTWSPVTQWLMRRNAYLVGPMGRTHMRWMEGWMGCHDKEEMRRKARDVYKAHYAHIRKVVPKEKLLEYQLGSGWEPLCAFLGKEVPEVPFPVVNESDVLNEKLAMMIRLGFQDLALRALKVVVPLVAASIAVWLYGFDRLSGRV